jgi:hypothetical protein
MDLARTTISNQLSRPATLDGRTHALTAKQKKAILATTLCTIAEWTDWLISQPSPQCLRASTDVAACNQICNQVHGFDRAGELRDAIEQNTASAVEHLGRIAGYTTGLAFSATASRRPTAI